MRSRRGHRLLGLGRWVDVCFVAFSGPADLLLSRRTKRHRLDLWYVLTLSICVP